MPSETERDSVVRALRATDAEARADPAAWIDYEHIVTERGHAIDWETHPFLLAPISDPAQEIVVRKAAQGGFTLIYSLKVIHAVAMQGLNAIYTYPIDTLLQAKVSEVVDQLIARNPVIGRLVGEEDSLHAKRIGAGWIWWVATESERGAISRAADLVCHDEYDQGNLINAELFDSRLGHSAYRLKWRFSNPTVPGVAATTHPNIDGLYEASDQKHWFVRCPCGAGPHDGHQYLDWPDSIDPKRGIFQCRYCGRELDRRRGLWWPRYPGRPVSGYWYSQLMAPWISAETIIAESAKDPSYFYRMVVGKPYLGGLELPWDQVIDRLLAPPVPDREGIVFGVDQGQAGGQWVMAGSARHGLLGAWNVPRWQDIDALATLWRPRICCVDADPEREAVRLLTERLRRLGCRVIPVDYIDSPRRDPELDYLDHKAMPVVAYRTQTLDAFALGPFASGLYSVRFAGPMLDLFRRHWRAMTPVYEEDRRGNKVRRWVSSGPDHLAHATVLWWLAATRFGGGGGVKVRFPKEEF